MAAPTKQHDVSFSHVEKVLFPEAGYTKGNVLKYYLDVADVLVPHLRDRPVTLERLPDGLRDGAPRFWQKNTPPYYPKWIPRKRLKTSDGRPVDYALVNDASILAYLVNQGALTFHTYLSHLPKLKRPDMVVFDLDPSEATFQDVVTIALHLRDVLDAKKCPAFVKTSGKSGLHVLVPWRQPGGFDTSRAWAMGIADQIVKELPKIATVERLKKARGRRVYVDVIQNAEGHHVVPPYVIRATAAGSVSTPLKWKEVTPRLDPAVFTLKTAPKRFKRQGDLLAGLLEG